MAPGVIVTRSALVGICVTSPVFEFVTLLKIGVRFWRIPIPMRPDPVFNKVPKQSVVPQPQLVLELQDSAIPAG